MLPLFIVYIIFDFLYISSTKKKPPERVVFYWYGFITTGRRTVRKFTQSVNLTREDSINIMGISVYAYRKQGKGNKRIRVGLLFPPRRTTYKGGFLLVWVHNDRVKKPFNASINRDVMIFIKKL